MSIIIYLIKGHVITFSCFTLYPDQILLNFKLNYDLNYEITFQDMRVKVEGMMKLLKERKEKLKVTENVITKKANVVDNVNKILNQKEIRIKQRERQKDELLAFGKNAAMTGQIALS